MRYQSLNRIKRTCGVWAVQHVESEPKQGEDSIYKGDKIGVNMEDWLYKGARSNKYR